MDKRLEGKVAIVTGAGQTPGDTVGNGRAIAVLFARAGAKVMLVDRRLDSAEGTQAMIAQEGGHAFAFVADVSQGDDCRRMAEECAARFNDPGRWQELMPKDPPPGEPSDVANLVAFLVSDCAKHITGTVVTVDGGYAAT